MSPQKSFLVRAVLVDMDGTTVDSNRIVEDSWGQICKRYDIDASELLAYSHGRLATDTVEKFLSHLSADEATGIIHWMQNREVELANLVVPIPGAVEFLTQLESLGVPWALVTSAPRGLAQSRFKFAGLPWPSAVFAAEDVAVGKPDPLGYRSAAEALGVDPSDTLVLEDAPPGVKAGLATGASVVVVGDHPDPRLNESPRIESLEGVTVRAVDAPGTYMPFFEVALPGLSAI